MIRSEVRAQVAANQPDVARVSDGPGDPAKKAAAVVPPQPQVEGPPVAPGRRGPPWLVRNSRKATFALVLAIVAALPFAYRHLQREYGPDPLAGIKLDGVRIDPLSGASEMAKPPDAKPAVMKPVAPAAAMGPAPKVNAPRQAASPAKPAAAAPVAHSVGVTHTRSAVVAPATPQMAETPATLQRSAAPRASEEPPASRACTEAVAALGLCNPDATAKGK